MREKAVNDSSMKILIVYMKEEVNTVDKFLPFLEEMKIRIVTLPLTKVEDGDIKKFIGQFGGSGVKGKDDSPSHVAIFSSLPKQWFDFLAGFSCGSRLPHLIYGPDAIPGISEDFASCFTFLHTEDSLLKYLNAENEAFKKQEAARKVIRSQETLLRMGIPVTTESLANCTAEGRTKEISLFLTAGFSPNSRNKAGVHLLGIAARSGNLESVRFLLSNGVELNLQADDRGTSALIDSVMAKHLNIMLDLIAAGADLNIKSRDGQTALVVAVGAGDEKMVEALLAAGADPDITDSLGASARKYAMLFKKEAITTLFNTLAPPKAG